MRKREELSNPNSCTNRANDYEMMFVLLGRDAAAPATIMAWIDKRIKLGKNQIEDEQIQEAIKCANEMSIYAWKLAMCVYAKSIQGDNYPGDDYYMQPETWDDAYKDGLTPEEAVDSDMSYWEAE
jgi:hypothetical protein